MKNICNILRQTVVVLSILFLAVGGGALAQNNNWQQHQQLQNTQLAETSQDEMKRGFTGKVTADGRALVKFQNRIFAVPAARLRITPRDTSTSPAALATSWSPQKQSAIDADIRKLAAGASPSPGTAAKGEPVKVASVPTSSRIDAARAARSGGRGGGGGGGGDEEPPANKAQEGSVAAKGGARSVDELSQAAAAADRGGLTAAGRAIQKHGGREGSAFPAAKGNPLSVNQQGQHVVDDILTSPGNTTVTRNHARFGQVTEVRAPDGRGVRYGADGKLIGFLEPNK